MKKFSFILIIMILIVNVSCLKRQFIEGRAEFISTTDTILNDSSLIYGHIYRLNLEGDYHYLENEFEIWLENTDLRTTNDINGYYSIKTKPGTYTIKCQSASNTWERLIEEMKVDLNKNTKTQIDFYIGYTIE